MGFIESSRLFATGLRTEQVRAKERMEEIVTKMKIMRRRVKVKTVKIVTLKAMKMWIKI